MPRKMIFTKVETNAERAKRMFRQYVAVLPTVHPVTWADASSDVREFWLEKARVEAQMARQPEAA